MADFETNVPLVIPTLTEKEKKDMQAYSVYYEKHRDKISQDIEEQLKEHPKWGGVIQGMSEEERLEQRKDSKRNQKEAFFNDNWEPYLNQLSYYGIFYARIGLDFNSWFELVNTLRRYLTPLLIKNDDIDSVIPILNGMDLFLNITMSNIGEAYLFEQKRIIKKQKHEQEILNKELENFVYIASHDLQEPLNTVSSFIDLLQEEYIDHFPAEAAEYLTYIKASSTRMTELITGLMDYSRVGKNRKFINTPIEELVEEVLADMKGRIDKNDAQIHIKGELPNLTVSRVELKMLFQNLLSNAIKFHKADEPPIINISAKQENGVWHFIVEDNGIGIEKKNKDKIFIIFRRLHDSTEFDGTGIGLAHCKKIVDLHGGKIWVESEPGKGSAFHFTINENHMKQ